MPSNGVIPALLFQHTAYPGEEEINQSSRVQVSAGLVPPAAPTRRRRWAGPDPVEGWGFPIAVTPPSIARSIAPEPTPAPAASPLPPSSGETPAGWGEASPLRSAGHRTGGCCEFRQRRGHPCFYITEIIFLRNPNNSTAKRGVRRLGGSRGAFCSNGERRICR